MLNIVILAAGMGKRMQSTKPKVLHTIAGQAMLSHVISTAKTLDPSMVLLVVGHGAEQVKAHYVGQPLSYAIQQPQLGTGHAVLQTIDQLQESGQPDDLTLILYGDVPLVRSQTLLTLLEACRAEQALGLLTVNLSDPTGYGRIVRNAHGKIQKIVEHKDARGPELDITEVNTGMMAVPTAWLKKALPLLRNDNAQSEYYLTDIVAMAVAQNLALVSVQPQAIWETIGVNSRIQQAELERVYQSVLADQLLNRGVMLADPQRIDVRGQLDCGTDVFIDVGCVFEGQVTLGDRVTVGPYCVLKNVEIQADTNIDAYSHLVDAKVGHGARVGPYARLRPGAVIGDQAHIGNFVEVKNSQIGTGSKANHLSYIGDASVGANVNIGAGVITANYDGVNKHQTIIEDDVSVGSDCQLVAPVRVGRGATIAAGTTLTADAPADQLTVARVKQVSLARWKRPTKA